MKNEGKKFESLIKSNAKEDGLFYLRLQDNLKLGSKVEGARFSQKSPYDGILFKEPYLFCLELKSTGTTSLSFGEESSKNIKNHQIKSLMEAANYQNVIPGFIIQFRKRETKKTYREEASYFIYIGDFMKFSETTNKKSISLEDCKKIGIEVPKQNIGKRVVKYKYLIKRMAEQVIIMHGGGYEKSINNNYDINV